MSEARLTETVLRFAIRSSRSRTVGQLHIAPVTDYDHGKLHRLAGVPLCQPDGAWDAGFLDFIPTGVVVCGKCVELAMRHGLELPDGLEEHVAPSEPTRGTVTYQYDSIWYNYNRGFPFRGYWRRWKWLLQHCVCAHCGAALTQEQGEEPVRGMELYEYFACAAGHSIKDERDITPRPGAGISSPDFHQAYPSLVAADDEVSY